MIHPIKILIKAFTLYCFCFFAVGNSSAQIQVTPATDDPYTPTNLIQNVFLGEGVEILNVSFEGNPVATGVFSNSLNDLGIQRGLVLSTGQVQQIPQPAADMETSGTSGESVFDEDLARIITGDLRDIVKYEITFRPISDTLRFNYVFASEEYPEYVCAQFNDIFGFFISGANPQGGTYNAENIALVPDPADPNGNTFTDFPVSINSVNPGIKGTVFNVGDDDNCDKAGESFAFSQYYNDNSGSLNLVFDGYSDVFTAQAIVVPCTEYTIKIAIADVTDSGINSAVFLGAKSFSSPTLKVERENNSSVDGSITEGCNEAILKFTLPGVSARDTIIDITILSESTATEGDDFMLNDNKVVISAGSRVGELVINAMEDNFADDDEELRISYQKDICTVDTLRIVIRDKVLGALDLGEDPPAFCEPGGHLIDAQAPISIALPNMPAFVSNQRIDIDSANVSYSSIINVSDVSPNILGPGMIAQICIDELEHRWLSDLELYITSPGGQVLELSTDNGEDGGNTIGFDNLSNTCFTLDATIEINNGNSIAGPLFNANPTYTGNFQPEGDWSDLWSTENPVNGEWKLTVIDDVDGGNNNSADGTLLGWSISFNAPYNVKYEWSPNDGTVSQPDSLNTLLNPTENTRYILTATDSYGCEVKDTIVVGPGVRTATPEPPRCTPSSNSIILDWRPVDFATEYELKVDDEDWFSVGTNLFHTFEELEFDKDYVFSVRAIGIGCVSEAASSTCTTELCTPSLFELQEMNPSGSCNTDGSIQVIPLSGKVPYTFQLDGVENATGLFEDLIGGEYLIFMIDSSGCGTPIPFTLTQGEELSVEIVVERELSCWNTEDADLIAFPRGGELPYDFSWSNGVEDFANFNVGAGQYILSITDANMCTATDTVMLQTPPPMVIGQSVKTGILCKDALTGSITYPVSGGSPPYEFQWNDPAMQTDSIAINLSAGSYRVTISDQNGCAPDPLMEILLPNNGFILGPAFASPSCAEGNDGQVSVDINNGQGPFQFLWTDDSGEEVSRDSLVTGLPAGSYKVVVTDVNACTQDTIILLADKEPIVITETIGDAKCNDSSDGSIVLGVVGGTGPGTYTFEWSNGETTESLLAIPIGEYCLTLTDLFECKVEKCFEVSGPPPFSFSAIADTVSCFGGTDGAISIDIGGSVEPIVSYLWTAPNTFYDTPNLDNIEAGEYRLVASDNIGCLFDTTIFVKQNSEFEVALSSFNVACKGVDDGKIDLLVSGARPNYNFQWNKDGQAFSTEQNISDLGRGNYDLLITDSNSCPYTDQIVITEPDEVLELTLENDTICNAATNGILELKASGGVEPFEYLWNDSTSTAAHAELAKGDYVVTISDFGGCVKEISASVLEVERFELTIDQEGPLCRNGTDGKANIAAIAYTFGQENLKIADILWNTSPIQKTLDVIGLTGGTQYIVQVTDDFGCKSLDSVTIVNPPQFEIGLIEQKDIRCFAEDNGSIQIEPINGNGPFEYSWGANTNFQSGSTVTELRKGVHTVLATDVNRCTADAEYEISEPIVLDVESRAFDALCFGESTGRADILVTGGVTPYSYMWSSGATTEVLQNTPAGEYAVTVSDFNGCTIEQAVEVGGPVEALDFEYDIMTPVCAGSNTGRVEVFALGGNGFYTYSADGQIFNENSTLVGLVDGVYSITVKDNKGCSITKDSILISNAEPLNLFIGGDTTVLQGNEFFVGANIENAVQPVEYEWTVEPASASFVDFTDFLSFADLDRSIVVTLTIVDSLGCTATALRKIDVNNDEERYVLVPTGFTPNGDGTNDFVRVFGRDGVIVNSFKVYSRWGHLVYSDSEFEVNDESRGWDGRVNNQELNSDVFTWVAEVTFEDGFKITYQGSTQLIR